MTGHAEGSRLSDRYLVLGPLGEGGMGVVLRAKDERLGRLVAVKVLSASAVGDASARERLVREARAAAALEHPSIVSVYDVGETEDGTTFLVMELVRGASLRALLDRGALTAVERLRALVDVARALGFAHRAGVLHRDVKPDNVMIREDGRTVLMDFGIAKRLAAANDVDTVRELTTKGAFIGTIAYLAPEIARGLVVDGRADQFSLALTAYEAMAGRGPWKGASALEVLSEIVRDEAVELDLARLRAATGSAASELLAVLRRGLAKAPEDRYPTMEAFADDLEGLAGRVARGAESSVRDPALEVTEEARVVARPPSTPPITATVPAAALPPAPSPASVPAPSPSSVPAPSPSSVPSPIPAPAPAPRSRRWRALVAVGIVSVVGLLLAPRLHGIGRPSSAADASAPADLASRDVVIACPQLGVGGVEEPSGWLGAAIATLICGRTQVLLGGESARTLIPAELLDLPRMPVDDFPLDPFGAPEARTRSIAASKARAAAWFDGTVTRRGEGLSVVLVLRSKDDRELARGEGAGRHPVQAVRAAMEALRGPSPLPTPSAASPWLAAWMRVRSTNAALLLHDQAVAAATEDVEAMRVECARLTASADLLPEVKYAAGYECAYRLYGPRPSAPAGIDPSSPGAMRFMLSATEAPPPEEARKSARRMHELFEVESDPQGRALLAGTEALLLMFAGDPAEAGKLARRSLAIDPKVAEPWTSTWRIFAFASGDRARTATSAGWIPWDPYATLNAGEIDPAPDAKLRHARRAAILAPGGAAPGALVSMLLKARRTEEARGVAATAATPVLDVEVRAAEAHFAGALAEAMRAFTQARVTEEGAVDVFEVARASIDPALILERPLDFADDLVTRFVDAEPPTLPRSYSSYLGLVATCTYAPSAVARRCLPRLRALHARGLGFPGASVAPLLVGAERYVNGDYAGAAKAWRPLLKDGGRATDALRHAMALTFDHESQFELATKLDAEAVGGRFNGADLADVRAARRALRSGERETARKHAARVIAAWSVADDTVPAVSQMRRLGLGQ